MKTVLFNPEPCVLVVDDHEISRQHTVEAVLSVTNHVTQASNGLEAMEYALGLMPDLIFTDIHLPDTCGLSLPARIREAWPPDTPQPAFVILTGDDSDLMQHKAEKYAVSSILIKPVPFCEIRNITLRLLKLEQSVQEYSTPHQTQVQQTGLRKHFLKELKTRLPELDRDVSSLDWASAAELTHQLIASSAMCREQNLELRCRHLHSLMSGNAPTSSIAHAYYSFLQAVERIKIEL